MSLYVKIQSVRHWIGRQPATPSRDAVADRIEKLWPSLSASRQASLLAGAFRELPHGNSLARLQPPSLSPARPKGAQGCDPHRTRTKSGV